VTSRNCPLCDVRWPNDEDYRQCPQCMELTELDRAPANITTEEARARRSAGHFGWWLYVNGRL
jgi:hypothetical protein